MEARQQIDTVLKHLYNEKDKARAITVDSIKADKKLLAMAKSESEIERMLIKMRDDKYVQMYPDYPRFPDGKQDMSKGLLNFCSITFDGRLFWEDGGYTKQAETNATVERIRNKREKLLSYGTVWLAILTGALVLTEILIHWHELSGLFCH
jgi:hypothetical protein